MARKSDYLKGVTAGLKLKAKHPAWFDYKHAWQYKISALARNAEEKYRDSLPDTQDTPDDREAGRWSRASRYWLGILHAFDYGEPSQFVIVKHNGNGYYNLDSLASRVVYENPADAARESWRMDPSGHLYKELDILYVHGAKGELLKPAA